MRSYNLALYANPVKLDTARYAYERHLKLVNFWAGRLFFNGNKSLSTANLGGLANRAQQRARGVVAALTASSKETGNKMNVPVLARVGCPAKIEASKNSFDYWLTVEHGFEKAKRVALPVKSHRKLNTTLKDGWHLNPVAEFFKDKNGRFYARVFVHKEVARPEPKRELLGVDVGYRHGACDSDGYIGKNTGRVIKQSRERAAQRQRQGLKVSGPKTRIKQLLDREAKRAVDVATRTGRSLAVEAPKSLANLRSGKLQGWATSYFASRCHVLGKERGVFIWEVNPAYSSQICFQCEHKDKQSRSGVSFVCTWCGHKDHADVNAARNIARKGTVSLNAIRNRKMI